MKITKPKENQLLIEDDGLKNFKLEVGSYPTPFISNGYNNTGDSITATDFIEY